VPPVSAPAAVEMLGATATVRFTVALLVVSPAEVAVMVAIKLLAGEAGAVYTTVVVVDPLSVPQADPLHPVPLSIQVTPMELLLAVAVSVTESPGSTLLAAGVAIVTPMDAAAGELELPQPMIPCNARTARNKESTGVARERRLDRTVLRTGAGWRMETPGLSAAFG